MEIALVPAQSIHPPDPVADLIWTTDVPLMQFLFGTKEHWRRVLAYDWKATRGITCHRQSTLAMHGDAILGVMVSHTLAEFDENFICTRKAHAQNEGPQFQKHLARAFDLLEQLFPHPLEGSYFVFDLAVSQNARGSGIGRKLIDVAIAKARDNGCERICLDVAAENDAVQFYKKLGMNVAVETRIPELDKEHGVGTHYHMVLPI